MTEHTRAILVRAAGGPDTLVLGRVELPPPASGEVRVCHSAIGVDFIDVYLRTGLYPPPGYPFVPGFEATGVIEAAGQGVEGFAVGERVAYVSTSPGAYAERRNVAAAHLVRLPEGVSDELAAAALLKGLTAWYLLRRTFRVERGTRVLIHAAAGGVGSLLVQWAVHLGAEVFGTVGSDAKADRAREDGCTHPIVYTREDFVEQVRVLTGGEGVDVVYDSVGRDTFGGSLDCLRRRGMLVTFGQSSGPVPPIDPREFAARGSLFLTRPSLFDYIAERADLEEGATELFGLLAAGVLHPRIDRRLPLAEAAAAHRALEARETAGALILVP